MSSRRPRIKPVANLTARRIKSEKSVDEKLTDEPNVIEVVVNVKEEGKSAVKSEKVVQNEVAAQSVEKNSNDEIIELYDEIIKTEKPISQPEPIQGKGAVATTNRRRIKPTITLPQRKAKIQTDKVKQKNESEPSDKVIPESKPDSVVHEVETTVLDESVENVEMANPPSNESAKIANFEEPIDDSVFKSPQNFLSPRYNPPTPKMHPFNNEISPLMLSTNEPTTPKDDLRCPLSPTKVRQRIKAVPMLGNRRNSIQGRDEGDEIPRRQRHLSSSSSHSNQNSSMNYKTMNSPGYPYSNRMRTESSCSNASDISVVKEVMAQKPRRINRSEEHYRLNEAKRGFRERFQNSVPDKSQLKMYDMIFYNPTSNPMKNAVTIKEDRRGSSAASSISSFVGKRDPSVPGPTAPIVPPIKSKSEENAMPVPQLKIGPNGDIIIDEKSLVIETTSEKTARETLANSDIVYDDEFSGTQGFYKRQLRMRDWGRSETIKFYRCLQTIGTDFSMMLALFPKRNRRELKLKFKKEEKINPGLINKALLCPKTFNIEQLEMDFKHDEEVQQLEVERLKLKRIQDRKEFLSAVAKAQTKRNYKSRTYQYLQKGDYIYENENVLAKTLVKQRRTKSKIYENQNAYLLANSGKRIKLNDHELLSNDKDIIDGNDEPVDEEEIEHELNNNHDENVYTPNLNLLENSPHHVIAIPAADESMECEKSSCNVPQTVLTNGTGFNTLVSNCGKSYFSSDMTTQSPLAEQQSVSPKSVNLVKVENKMGVKQSNLNKTDILLNDRIPSKSIPNTSSSGEENDFDSDTFLNGLVAAEIQDPLDSSKVQYNLYTVDAETGNLSDKPLDLPVDVVNTIVTKCCKK